MIREERDPAFWSWVASDPAVLEGSMLQHSDGLETIVTNPIVTPLASEHGGFILVRLDGLGRTWELHTLFRREGWGRGVVTAAHEALSLFWSDGAQVLVTYEVEGNWRSRPPKSHGWKPAGQFAPTPFGSVKSWVLTRLAWEGSPASQRRA